jgi:hypothetical protein
MSNANATINDIRCDPATAERIYTSPAGHHCVTHNGFRRFDEVLDRNAEGFYFLVRPMAPDEARAWMSDPRHDTVLASRLFPADDAS